MRKIVVALVAALLAVMLAGCGGETAAPVDNVTTTTPVVAPVISQPFSDRSPTEGEVYELFPSLENTQTPEAIANRLQSEQPMMIFVYDNDETETNDVRNAVDAALASHAGLVGLVALDLTEPPEEIATPEDIGKREYFVTVARELGAGATPYIIIVNRWGYITWRWSGYADAAMIEREIMRATE